MGVMKPKEKQIPVQHLGFELPRVRLISLVAVQSERIE